MRIGVAGAIVGGIHRSGDVEIDADTGLVTGIGLAGHGRGLAIPGLVDLQVNGFAGVDFLNAGVEDFASASAALARTEVLAYQPTLITSTPEHTLAALATIAKAQDDPSRQAARILGAHLEGPFLSPNRPGTHTVNLLRAPELALTRRFLEAGPVTEITLAPELPGAQAVIAKCVRAGVLVACGHTDATAEQAHAAFDHGARLATHLFDAMRPFTHRDPGIIGVALTRRETILGLITDPSHVSPEAVRPAFQAAPGRIALVTDALAAASSPDGHYRLGDVEFEVTNTVARRSDGTLVGGTGTLLDGTRHARAAGVSLEDAVNAASVTPASLHPHARLGLLRPGAPADLVVLDDDLTARAVFRRGTPIDA